ncbi:four helix bundle protein [Saccharicrinis sp. FJH62]|uniref:four helix bundle protein n=1 Tax=Saccharicrinis sp. FJH62 TaxID=3344657 RepID=UPI0035D498F8
MSSIKKFEELFIWIEAKDLVLQIYQLFKSNRDYAFGDQIQRAAVSIMNKYCRGFREII